MFFKSINFYQPKPFKQDLLSELTSWLHNNHCNSDKFIRLAKNIIMVLKKIYQHNPVDLYDAKVLDFINFVIDSVDNNYRPWWMRTNKKHYAKIDYAYMRIKPNKHFKWVSHFEHCFFTRYSNIILDNDYLFCLFDALHRYLKQKPQTPTEQVILASRLIHQGQRDRNSFFSHLPDELAVMIAAKTVNLKEMNQEEAVNIANKNLNRPVKN